MAPLIRGPLGGPRFLFVVLIFLSFCMGEAPRPPVGPTEEAEPYMSDSRWGRAVKQRWEDEHYEDYLREEVLKMNEMDFWVDLFVACLPSKPERERQRQDRTARRKQEKLKGERDKDRKLGRQQGSSPKLAVYGEWLQAYSADPFRGLEQLPLQTFISGLKGNRERDDILLQQLEEENAFGAFRVRSQHLKTLTTSIRKRVFTGEAPRGPGPEDSQAPGNPVTEKRHQGGGPLGNPHGGPLAGSAFHLPIIDRNGVKVPWLEIATEQYLPAIEGVPEGNIMGRQFLGELSDALDALDVEEMLRAAPHSPKKHPINMTRSNPAPTAAANGLT